MLFFVNNDVIFLQLNYYLTSVLFAMILDSFIIVRIERAFSTKPIYSKKVLMNKFVSNYFLFFIIMIFISFLEYYSFDTFFSWIIFSRHIYNVSRLTQPYLTKMNYVAMSSNILVILRNLFIITILFYFDDINVILIIAIISICEILIMFKLYYKIFFHFRSISLKNISFKRKDFFRKSTAVNLVQFLSSSVDRLLIIFFFGKEQEEIYFKYKLIQQYIDAGYSVFGYKIHLDIMMKNNKNLFKHLSLVFFILQIMSISVVLYIFDISLLKSLIVFEILLVLLVWRRLFDSYIGALCIKGAFYNLIIVKNLLESFLISSFIVILWDSYLLYIDRLYIIIIIIQITISIGIFIYTRKKDNIL